ncbi:glycosyl transferase group 1, partial [mine drainage metagenome]
VHDFGLRTLASVWTTEPQLLAVEVYSFVGLIQTPRFLRRCTRLVSISQLTREVLARRTGLDSVVIHHWADDKRFHPRLKQEARAGLGLPLNRKVILNVSAGTANKNLRMLRSVIRALPEDYVLVKVGFPIKGCEDRVRNLGTVPAEVYPQYFNAADAYVHCSLTEGFGRP